MSTDRIDDVQAMVDKAWGRFEAELERGKRYPLDLVCLYSDDCKTLMSKGHHEPAAFLAEVEAWNGGPLEGWGKVRHGWHRTIPDSTGEYRTLMHPAKPHARGAYPTTCIVDDANYDQWDTEPAAPTEPRP